MFFVKVGKWAESGGNICAYLDMLDNEKNGNMNEKNGNMCRELAVIFNTKCFINRGSTYVTRQIMIA